MYYELPKKDKKVARQLMDKGILIEFEQGLNKFYQIMEKWKNENADTKDTYHELFNAVRTFDKHIARRYDGVGGSRYLETVIIQLENGLYDISEADNFSDDVKAHIHRFLEFRKSV